MVFGTPPAVATVSHKQGSPGSRFKASGAGFDTKAGTRVESVERSAIVNQLAALVLEHLPDRALQLIDMTTRLGVGDLLVMAPGVQIIIGLEAQSRREEVFPHQIDPVITCPSPSWTPACRRPAARDSGRTSAGIGDCIADEHRLHRCLLLS